MNRDEFDAVTEGYISYCKEVKRLHARTLVDMRCTYRKLSEYLQKEQREESIWQLSLESYMQWIGYERNKGKNGRSLNKQLSHIRRLIEYAWRSKRLDRNVLEGFNVKDGHSIKKPEVLSLEEAEALIEASRGPTPQARRSRLVVLLCYGCGLRTGEVVNLNVQDIDREKQEVIILNSKGGTDRCIPVPEGVWTELMAYLADRGGKRGPLFKTPVKKKRIRQVEVSTIVRELSQAAGIEKHVTPRVLRHSFATHLMAQDVSIGVISMLMGHRSPRETGIYVHALDKHKEDAVKELYKDMASEDSEENNDQPDKEKDQ